MKTTFGSRRAAVLFGLVPAMAVAVVVALWAATPAGGSIPELVGAGPGLGGLLWTCGLCAGRAALLVAGGSASVVGWLAASTNLAKMTACASACFAALTV